MRLDKLESGEQPSCQQINDIGRQCCFLISTISHLLPSHREGRRLVAIQAGALLAGRQPLVAKLLVRPKVGGVVQTNPGVD